MQHLPYLLLEEIKINPTKIKQSYLNSIKAFKEQLVQKCGMYQIVFVEADINKGYDNALYTYLVKRYKMINKKAFFIRNTLVRVKLKHN